MATPKAPSINVAVQVDGETIAKAVARQSQTPLAGSFRCWGNRMRPVLPARCILVNMDTAQKMTCQFNPIHLTERIGTCADARKEPIGASYQVSTIATPTTAK